MRSLLTAIFILFILSKSIAQISDDEKMFLDRLKPTESLPEKLLNTRTAVFYSFIMPDKELEKIQLSFQKTGIDAIMYFETDELLAGRDVKVAFTAYLNKRDVSNLVFLQKGDKGYKMFITTFNTKSSLVEENQYAWIGEHTSLDELLLNLYRAAGGGMKRQNMLINDYPETNISINAIQGRRAEFFAIDMKVDELAIPKTGNDVMDKVLETTFSTYPFKYKLTEPGTSEQELRKKGSLYVLCYVHTRCSVAKKLLGYDTSKPESTVASVIFADDGQTQIKNIAPETFVYKFYFKHIDSGNVFFGTKWDADPSWEQALKNQYKGFKAEFKIP